MTTMTTMYRSAVSTRRDGYVQLVLAEWTKLRSVPRWLAGMVAAAVLTVLVSLLIASASTADANVHRDFVVGPDGEPVVDSFHFVHQPLSGDGSVIARVGAQTAHDEPNAERVEWARAGVMIKASTESGSPYAAVMVTTGHGVRMQSNFTTDLAGSRNSASRWLKLTRSGSTITGYESADGSSWNKVGSVELDTLPRTVEIGLFVASPPEVRVERQAGSTSVGELPTLNTASFDNIRVATSQPRQPASWASDDIGRTPTTGRAIEEDGGFAVTGSGDIAPKPPPDDVVQISLFGAVVGMMALVAVSVLFITSEYKGGMIRTTFAACPRRGRVLAAKALVICVSSFVIGLIGSVAAFLLAQPMLRANGFGPPAFPPPSLTDGPVVRAVVGTAALLAVVAVCALAVGAIVRRSAAAITGVIGLFIVPMVVASALPPSAAEWLIRVTPAAGLAIQRAKEPTDALFEPWAMVEPWNGFGALCAYAVVTLAIAFWLLRRRDA